MEKLHLLTYMLFEMLCIKQHISCLRYNIFVHAHSSHQDTQLYTVYIHQVVLCKQDLSPYISCISLHDIADAIYSVQFTVLFICAVSMKMFAVPNVN